jgi:hypothetical protein
MSFGAAGGLYRRPEREPDPTGAVFNLSSLG